MQKWNETIEKLEKEKEPVDSVQQVLMTSYKALDQETKDIFLDIACFFIGKDKRIPFYMWEDCGFNPSSDIERLLLMSLVRIEENNKLSVYDLLRDLGRTIVYEEDPMNPGRRSRLWDNEQALNTLKRKEKRRKVQALCLKLDNGSHKCLTPKEFESLSKLRFLKLDNANIEGDFANLLPHLRWLDWRGCPPTFQVENLCLKNLVILDLSWSKVTQKWGGWSQIEMPRLKVLNLTGCNEMQITPNFSGYPQLEMLILESCFQLVMIDPSICHLRLLVSMNLKSCGNLSVLPQGIGDMESLKELLIDGTSIQEIPESIACMKKLETLSASNCYSLTKLPKSICLEALSMLLLDNAKILELPDSIGSLVKLKRLSLRDCQEMEKLPGSIGELGCSLVELDISRTLISELPDSMRNLQLLRVLKMERCHVRKFPRAIGRLRKLEEIHASHCRSLKGSIPSDIGNLKFLKILMLGYSCVSSLPPSIQSLSRLQILDLLACDNLETLPMLPSSLTCLRISSKKMSIIPDLQNLDELEDLTFGDENPKELIIPPLEFDPASILTEPQSLWPVRFPKLKSFELSHSQLTDLGFEYGSTCNSQLKEVVLKGGNLREVSRLPLSLSVLSIQACLSLQSLPTVWKLANLLELELLNSAVKEIKGLGGLTSLEILVVSCCRQIVHLDGLSNLISLKRLSLKNCKTLANLPSVSKLTMLKCLEIHRCRRIRDIEGLEKLTSLEELRVSECNAERSSRVTDAQERIRRRWSASP
ncbi:disease resistance protein RPV1-like [Syzygium oleosum]|uniref:disease resistance protein RPV1-like n=1 Tax=Syzygium oleosum TaxID=219896 RepID=UPI0011D22B3D|nr:disease resistance protein RPV1-like [Syzygium oleosum]